MAVLVCLVLAWIMHLFGLASTAMNVLIDVTGARGIGQVGWGSLSDEERGEMVGRAIAFGACGLYSAIGLVLIPIAAWGVHGRQPWARTTALAYFASTLITCCCTPLGACGIYALMRADVRALFDEKSRGS